MKNERRKNCDLKNDSWKPSERKNESFEKNSSWSRNGFLNNS